MDRCAAQMLFINLCVECVCVHEYALMWQLVWVLTDKRLLRLLFISLGYLQGGQGFAKVTWDLPPKLWMSVYMYFLWVVCVCVCSSYSGWALACVRSFRRRRKHSWQQQGISSHRRNIHENCVCVSTYICVFVCVWCLALGMCHHKNNNRFLCSLNSWMHLSASSPYLYHASALYTVSCRSFETQQTPHSRSRLAAVIGPVQEDNSGDKTR